MNIGSRCLITCSAVALVLLTDTCASAAIVQPSLDLSQLDAQVGLADATISPDGKVVAVVVSRPDYIDNRYVSAIVLVDIASGVRRDLTPTRFNVAHPQWSPDGESIAWLDHRLVGGAQICTATIRDPVPAPTCVTDATEGVKFFRWSPDGKSFAYITADPPVARTGDDRLSTSFEVGDDSYLTTKAPTSSQIWIVRADTREARRLTTGSESIRELDWLPDGSSIVYASQPGPHYGELVNISLHAIRVDSAQERSLGNRSEGAWPDSRPLVSPDGRLIAYRENRAKTVLFHPAGAGVTDLAGRTTRTVTETIDRDIQEIAWMPNSAALLVASPDGTRFGMWLQPLDGAPTRLDLADVTAVSDLTIGRSGVVSFIGTEPTHPPELYVIQSLSSRPRRLTAFNEHIAHLNLGHVESLRWRSDGSEVNGVLIYPPNFTKGQKAPLVLSIHGGPMSNSLEAWSPIDQLLASHGWIVFSPNYRGSNNQGDAFQSSVIDDAGDGPGRDVMAGIAAVRALGVVDEDRVAVSGWSYGGYMTVWLTSHYAGWRAAVAGAAVTDWTDWYDFGEMNVWAGEGLNGSPWRGDNLSNYWRQSPIIYANKIKTPMLILSDTGDSRVPITQSYKLYHALKDNEVPVQFIAYAVDGHFPGNPVDQRDVVSRWVDWIDQHFH
jgi:dipeptidyl aminopeptidase/acylaminoacyl peptidase